ncbi:PP2C family protein-serine/threonine phosphatase [Streptomyces sp. NPDC096311]|uniref:PP2C family protein-serine/threonine phosphatase n=1 Tax=Streptomyces sp. NPDC096311 TaxID=3366083 RepID=UPI0038011460
MTLQALAGRAAASIDTARRYRYEHTIALELQRAPLSGPRTPHPAVEVAARYLPSGRSVLVGGDWYDSIPLPDSRTLLVMGDVMGHGFRAAVAISQYRSLLADIRAGFPGPGASSRTAAASLRLEGVDGLLELRNLHLAPSDPRNWAWASSPLKFLATPRRRSLIVGDMNSIGLGFPEPDWTRLSPHLHDCHLGAPGHDPERVSDREAVELLARAGFVDAASRMGRSR